MTRQLSLAAMVLVAATATASAQHRHARLDANGNLDALIAKHAAANNVPEKLVRRIIHRESRGNPRAVSKGNYGLMQIRLGTARAMGYRGSARGLLDADTNMTYAVKYLAGAYRAAGGNPDRAVHYYAAGYYYAAKRKGLLDRTAQNPINAFASAAAAGEPTVRGSENALARAKGNAALAPARTVDQSRKKVEQAQAAGENVASSSSLYTGKLDYF